MLKNKTILLTGGTGSFGSAFVPLTIKKFKPKKLIIYSRDESKQWDMRILYSKSKNIQFVIGDVRDYETLKKTMVGVVMLFTLQQLKLYQLQKLILSSV